MRWFWQKTCSFGVFGGVIIDVFAAQKKASQPPIHPQTARKTDLRIGIQNFAWRAAAGLKPLATPRPWVTIVGNICGLACILGLTGSNRWIKSLQLPRNVAPGDGALQRAQGDEGALAPSCRAPQGQDQISSAEFWVLSFFLNCGCRKSGEKLNCHSSNGDGSRRNRLYIV